MAINISLLTTRKPKPLPTEGEAGEPANRERGGELDGGRVPMRMAVARGERLSDAAPLAPQFSGITRRNLFANFARWVASSAMVVTLGVMTRRKGETCINDTICRTCELASNCGLPQALSFRDAMTREKPNAR